jgi:hypothetical protein
MIVLLDSSEKAGHLYFFYEAGDTSQQNDQFCSSLDVENGLSGLLRRLLHRLRLDLKTPGQNVSELDLDKV